MHRYFLLISYKDKYYYIEQDLDGTFKDTVKTIKAALPAYFAWEDITYRHLYLLPSWYPASWIKMDLPDLSVPYNAEQSETLKQIRKVLTPVYTFRGIETVKDLRKEFDFIRERFEKLSAHFEDEKEFVLCLALYFDNYWEGLPDIDYLDSWTYYEISTNEQISDFICNVIFEQYELPESFPYRYLDEDYILQDLSIDATTVELPCYVKYICFN